MTLLTQVENWRKYWCRVSDADEVERQLQRLRWLEEFAFHCGPEISPDHFEVLQHQIEAAESKLSELRGDVPKTLLPAPSQLSDFSHPELAENGAQETHDFGTPQVSA